MKYAYYREGELLCTGDLGPDEVPPGIDVMAIGESDRWAQLEPKDIPFYSGGEWRDKYGRLVKRG